MISAPSLSYVLIRNVSRTEEGGGGVYRGAVSFAREDIIWLKTRHLLIPVRVKYIMALMEYSASGSCRVFSDWDCL